MRFKNVAKIPQKTENLLREFSSLEVDQQFICLNSPIS